MATWKKILTETHTDAHPAPTNRDTRNQVAGSYQASGTYNTVIGTDSDLSLGTTEHIAAINVTDGVITSMSKQTLSIGDLSGTTAATQATALALKSPKASPTFTGTPAAPTAATSTDTTQLATTAYVKAQGYTGATDITSKANIASQAFTGTPSLPTGTTGVTQTAGNSSTKLATTAFVAGATSAGDLTAVVAGAGMTGSSLSGPIPTLNVVGGTGIKSNADDIALDLSELADQTSQVDSTDELIMLNGGTVGGRKRFAEINLGQFVNDQSWTSNSGTTTASNSQTFTNKGGNISQWTNNSSYVTSSGVTSVGVTAPVATSGGATPTISMAAASGSVNGYLTSANFTNIANTKTLSLANEVKANANTAAAALNTTHRGVTGGVHAVGTVTSVSAGTGIDISGSGTVTPTVNVDLSELASHTIGTGAGTITISGNLTVTGTTTTVNTEEILLADNNIVLNHGNAGAGADGGITIDRGSESDMKFYWNEAKDTWYAQNGTTASGGNKVLMTQVASGAPDSNDNGGGVGQFYTNSSTQDIYIRTA